jgi:hypothetical protein
MWYAIALVSATLGGWLAHRFSKGSKPATIGGVALGLALVFYNPLRDLNSRVRLSPTMHIEVPANFEHDTVIFITDSKATAEIDWSEETSEGRIASPKSGVIRVKSLGRFAFHESRALLSNGRQDWGRFNSYINGAPFMVYDFKRDGASEPQVGLMSDAEVVRYFRERESEQDSEPQPDF